jgi:putative peptidoglycan lipid II flippase
VPAAAGGAALEPGPGRSPRQWVSRGAVAALPRAERPPGAEESGETPGPDAARVVALGLVLSKPAAYVREAVLAARFGTGAGMDAFVTATTAAQAAWSVVGTPLARVLVPVLVRASAQRGRRGLETTSGAVLFAGLGISLALGVGLLLLAGPLAIALAGPRAHALAVLLRWLSPLPLALTLSTFATGWLQARQRFTLPAFVPLPLDLGVVGFVLFAGHHGILAAVWGTVVGTALQFVLQWPGMRRHGFRARWPASPAAAWADPGVASVGGMALPLLVSAGAQQAATLLQQAVGLRLGVGNVAALNYATRVLDLPAALFTLPIVTVALPYFSSLEAAGRRRAAERAVRLSLEQLLAALVPSALFLLLLRRAVAAAIFEHGAFGHLSVAATAGALAGYAPFVVGYGLQQLFRVFFYARQDVRTPMVWDLVNLVVSGALDLALAPRWHQVGLALGMSVGTLVAAAGLWRAVATGGRQGGDGQEEGFARPWRGLCLPLACGTASLAAVLLAVAAVPQLQGGGWLRAAEQVAAAGAVGTAAYVAAFAAAGGAPLLRTLLGTARAGAARAAGR